VYPRPPTPLQATQTSEKINRSECDPPATGPLKDKKQGKYCSSLRIRKKEKEFANIIQAFQLHPY
jgi:hypothetical protein